jgi:hypothetical protein
MSEEISSRLRETGAELGVGTFSPVQCRLLFISKIKKMKKIATTGAGACALNCQNTNVCTLAICHCHF